MTDFIDLNLKAADKAAMTKALLAAALNIETLEDAVSG